MSNLGAATAMGTQQQTPDHAQHLHTCADARKINVCIVTGTTGVGKSRMVSHLVQSLPPQANVVVVSHRHANAYGLETTKVIAGKGKVQLFAQVFDFGSGCVCCSPDGDLTRLLNRLDSENTADGNEASTMTHLFLETTGVADVRPFLRVFQRSPSFFIHSTISVVDPQSKSQWWVEGHDKATLSRAKGQLKESSVVLMISHNEDHYNSNLDSLYQLFKQECPDAPILPAETTSFESITQSLRRSEGNLHHGLRHKLEECPACEEIVSGASSGGLVGSLWNPMPFQMNHDLTFSSACVEEIGGVIWSRCRPWLESLMTTRVANASEPNTENMKSPRVVSRIKGWLSIASEWSGNDEDLSSLPQRQIIEQLIVVDGVLGEPLRIESVPLESITNRREELGGEDDKEKRPEDQLLAMDSLCASKGPATCKLFFFGQGLKRAILEDEMRNIMVPEFYVPVADLATEYGEHIAAMFLNDISNLSKGVTEYSKRCIEQTEIGDANILVRTEFDIEHGGKSVNITISIVAETLCLRAHGRMVTGANVELPAAVVGSTIFLDLRPLRKQAAFDELERWFLSGIPISRSDLRGALNQHAGKLGGNTQATVLSLETQKYIFENILKHSCLKEHPVHHDRRKKFLENITKVALEGSEAAELYEPLGRALTEYSVLNTSRSEESSFYFRSFRTQNLRGAEASTVSLRCADTFGGVAGTSIKVWPAGVVLGRFLGARNDLVGKHVVEFGCGTGAAGVIALKTLAERQHVDHPCLLPSSYVFTDGAPASVENTRKNIAANQIENIAEATSIRVNVLDWINIAAAKEQEENMLYSSDLIIAADVFYDPDVAFTFVTKVVVPLLTRNSESKRMDCIVAASRRNDASWHDVLVLFESHSLRHEILETFPCPLDSPAPVHVLKLTYGI